jgi:hypothetical protein
MNGHGELVLQLPTDSSLDSVEFQLPASPSHVPTADVLYISEVCCVLYNSLKVVVERSNTNRGLAYVIVLTVTILAEWGSTRGKY